MGNKRGKKKRLLSKRFNSYGSAGFGAPMRRGPYEFWGPFECWGPYEFWGPYECWAPYEYWDQLIPGAAPMVGAPSEFRPNKSRGPLSIGSHERWDFLGVRASSMFRAFFCWDL